MNVYEILQKRGFIYQCTDEEAVKKLLSEGPVTLYVGYDATASSLHVGSLMTLMALKHLQQAGHKVIALMGGATTLIGDPSDRSDLRKMLTSEQIDENIQGVKSDIEKFLDFTGDKAAIQVNNLDWLGQLNYLEFLRDYGTAFSVNRMVAQESVKLRMETGLTFLEFNYSLLQAYDFKHLNKDKGCRLQMGGSDQWGNIVAGIDLTRRLNKEEVFGCTFPLLTTADGKKMGKSVDGAVWLNEDKLGSYDYYQYWINTHDDDVEKFLKYFTLLELDEISALCAEGGQALNKAKQRLAWEATQLCRGEKAAEDAKAASEAAFSDGAGDTDKLPTLEIASDRLGAATLMDLFVETGLCASRGDVKRLVKGQGAYLNDEVLKDAQQNIVEADFKNDECLLRSGKKKYYRIKLKK
jgi:tyrosyl-tRNA synthetase